MIKNSQGDKLICVGSVDGSVNLFKISKSELDRVKEFKGNIFPKCEKIVSKIISEGSGISELTNYVKFFKEGPQIKLLTSSNDGSIHIFDLEEDLFLDKKFTSDKAVNNCDFNFTASMLCCVGDSTEVEIFDNRTRKSIQKFKAFYDYGIVIKFQPNSEYIFATGNQDYSCKLWDFRKIAAVNDFDKSYLSLKTLWGHFDSIGDLCFTSNCKTNSQFLIFAENSCFLHVYNIKNDTTQTLSYIGELCGLANHVEMGNIYLGINYINPGILVYDRVTSCINDFSYY